jgi:hypothetical protein
MEIDSHGLYGDFDRDEAIERFPELNDIKDDELREMTVGVVRNFPDYFFTAPAATRHHPPEHRQRHGLWLHTKRVCTTFERMTQSMVSQNHLTWEEIDYGRAACITHEMFKYGIPPTSVQSPANNVGLLTANWLRDNTEMPEKVCDAVESHGGPWYAGSQPTSHLSQMVHIADLHASDVNNHVAVKDLHPVLEDAFPRVDER